jgi:RimJ/RimL family protein N-acetyltransferase
MSDTPAIHTERLILRGFTSHDFEPLATIVSDPEVVRYLDNGAPINREECWRGMALFIGHWQLRGYGWWAVEERRSGELIGRIGLYNPEGWPGIEIGWLLRRDVWGAGLATEGAAAALAYAFDVVGAQHVISIIDPDNSRSIRVAEKIGEEYERHLHHKNKDVVVYGTRAHKGPSSTHNESNGLVRPARPRGGSPPDVSSGHPASCPRGVADSNPAPAAIVMPSSAMPRA